jgi:hypothetical protein
LRPEMCVPCAVYRLWDVHIERGFRFFEIAQKRLKKSGITKDIAA